MHLIRDDVVVFVAGAFIEFLHLETGEQKLIRATGRGSVATIAVHPERYFFASGERGWNTVASFGAGIRHFLKSGH